MTIVENSDARCAKRFLTVLVVGHMVADVDKISPISDVQAKAKQLIATKDEMSYPDWKTRLRQARKESRAGKHLSLDAYVARRSR